MSKNQPNNKKAIIITAIVATLAVALIVTLFICDSKDSNDTEFSYSTGTKMSETENAGDAAKENEQTLEQSAAAFDKSTVFTSLKDLEGLEFKTVNVTMTDGQSFSMNIYPEIAPKTAENFLSLVSEGFYDGLTFHRVIEGFMAQGGDPEGTGMGGSENTIPGEFESNGYYNPLSHQRGVVSMARSNDPNSASSQFFICYDDASFLDGDYASFGFVTEGMEVVDTFLSDGTDASDKPLKDVRIASMTIVE